MNDAKLIILCLIHLFSYLASRVVHFFQTIREVTFPSLLPFLTGFLPYSVFSCSFHRKNISQQQLYLSTYLKHYFFWWRRELFPEVSTEACMKCLRSVLKSCCLFANYVECLLRSNHFESFCNQIYFVSPRCGGYMI